MRSGVLGFSGWVYQNIPGTEYLCWHTTTATLLAESIKTYWALSISVTTQQQQLFWLSLSKHTRHWVFLLSHNKSNFFGWVYQNIPGTEYHTATATFLAASVKTYQALSISVITQQQSLFLAESIKTYQALSISVFTQQQLLWLSLSIHTRCWIFLYSIITQQQQLFWLSLSKHTRCWILRTVFYYHTTAATFLAESIKTYQVLNISITTQQQQLLWLSLSKHIRHWVFLLSHNNSNFFVLHLLLAELVLCLLLRNVWCM